MSITLDNGANIQAQLNNAPLLVRQKVMRSLARRVMQLNKKRVIAQVDVDGVPFVPHKRGRKRKMLTRLMKNLRILSATEQEALLGFYSGGFIAAKHQEGYTQTFNLPENNRGYILTTRAPATRQQAKGLIAAGYKVKRKDGNGTATPTIKWITENLNMGKAGVILRVLRGVKESWTTTLPPRSILGVANADIAELTALALSEAQQALTP